VVKGHTGDWSLVCIQTLVAVVAVVGLPCVSLVQTLKSLERLPSCCCGCSCGLPPSAIPRRLDMEGSEHFKVSSTGGDGGG
jgi:hypothetical protein